MLLTEQELEVSYQQPQSPKTPELNSPTLLQTTAAAFRQDNVIGSAFAGLPYAEAFSQVEAEPDPNYNVISQVEARGLDDYSDKFLDVFNDEQFEIRASQIEGEIADRQTLSDAGASGVASTIIAGVFDPINLIPIGGQIIKGAKGATILQASINAAKVAAPSIALQESLLNSTQQTRTLGESVVNVTAGTVLSGLLGGSVTAISKQLIGKDFSQITKQFEDDLVRTTDKLEEAETNLYREFPEGDSVGAAKAFQTTLEQETLASGFGIEKATKFLNPILRLAQSDLKGVRLFSQDLVDQPIFTNKNFEGIPTNQSIENLRFEQDVRSVKIVETHAKLHKEHLKAEKKLGRKGLNAQEWREGISFALRNGDVGADNAMTKAAKILRKEILDPLKDKAIKLGLLPEDVDISTAVSYLTRMYSKEKILLNSVKFREVVGEWAGKKVKQVTAQTGKEFEVKISKLKGQLKKAKEGSDKFKDIKAKLDDAEFEQRRALEGLTEDTQDYIDNIVDDLFVKLTGSDRQPLMFEVPIAEHGPLKDRTWDIQDNAIQEFLENDSEFILESYNKSMTGQLLLKEQFGTVKFDEAIEGVTQEFKDFIKTVPQKDVKKATDSFKSNVSDLNMLWDLTNGTYKSAQNYDNIFVKGGHSLRTLNYMRLLGQVTVSSFADVGNLVLSNSFGRVFGDLLVPVIKNVRNLKPIQSELKDAGVTLERVLNTRIQSLTEVGDPNARGTIFARTMTNASNVFTRTTGILHWNDFMKGGAGILSQSRLIKSSKAFASGKKLSPGDDAFMRWSGLSDSDMIQIAKLQSQHGESQDGILLSGVAKWENDAIGRKFRAALNKNVNSTIVTKGLGDVPAFSNTEVGKTLLQFQNFSFAAHQRITIKTAQRLQKGDLTALQGVTSLMAMGMLVAYIKAEGFKRGSTDDWTVDKWILEGVDRSGLMPVMMMFNNPWERVGLPGLGAAAAGVTGNEAKPVSRYAARGTAESLLGPTFGTIADTMAAVNSSVSGEMTPSDVHRFRKLLPFQNVHGVKQLLDSIDPKVQERRE